MSSFNDQLLIDLLLKKDKQAFEFLYNTYSPALHGSIIDIVADKELAVDILQMAFLRAYITISSYDDKKQKLYTWLLHIARRLSLEIMQSINKWPSASDLEKLSGNMRHILDKMDEGQKDVIRLMYYKGYSKAQVAEALNISIETVETLFQNGMWQLQVYINSSL